MINIELRDDEGTIYRFQIRTRITRPQMELEMRINPIPGPVLIHVQFNIDF